MSAAVLSIIAAIIASGGTVLAAVIVSQRRTERKADEITVLVNGQLREAIARIAQLSQQLGHEQGPPGTPPIPHV